MKKVIYYTIWEMVLAVLTIAFVLLMTNVSLYELAEIPNEIIKNGYIFHGLLCVGFPLLLAYLCEKHIKPSKKYPILQGVFVIFGILTISVIFGSFIVFLQDEYERQIFFNDKIIAYFNVRWNLFFEEYLWYVLVFYLFGGIQTLILGVLLGVKNIRK